MIAPDDIEGGREEVTFLVAHLPPRIVAQAISAAYRGRSIAERREFLTTLAGAIIDASRAKDRATLVEIVADSILALGHHALAGERA